MMIRKMWARILAVGLLSFSSIHAGAQVNVTTWHNDLARTGANTQETTLTTANVNVNSFGKLFTAPLDGQVYAQTLYLSNVSIGGGTHNVVYIATEHDSVYAIDADSGVIYAQVSLIPPGGTTVNSTSDINCGDINPEVGITGTPVIDPARNILYVVSTAKVNGIVLQQLHALSTLTLAEQLGGPVEIQASVPGTAPDGDGTTLVFNPVMEHQRPGLALENGHVVIGWGSHCDNAPYHGWLMSYNASTLAQEAVWNTTPDSQLNGSQQSPQGGIWMAGAAPAVDADGNLYVTSGNGYWDGKRDYSDSVLKLGPPANRTFPLLDYFTPFDQGGPGDSDVGSAGTILFPGVASGAQLMVQQGKQGTIYLTDRNNLGHNCASFTAPCSSSDTQINEELRGATPGVLSSPIYWNGFVYWPSFSYLTAWSIDPTSGLISKSPSSQSAQTFARTAAASLSANGTSNGILWLMQNTSELFAFDATNLANILWTSGQAPNGRDRLDSAVKFEPPTIANGKVYYGTADELVVLGLLGTSTSSAATPTFAPGGGTYTAAQSVKISDSTPSATVYYTVDGTTPTTASPVYAGPIAVSSSTTIKAIAAASGLTTSPVATATYTILQGTTATPTFTPAAGSYTGTQSVTLADSTAGATIYYTTNGATPTTGSTVYAGPIVVSATQTIKAIAAAANMANSAVATAAYTINPVSGGATPVNYPTGFSSATGFTLDGGATVTGGALQVTDGGTYENRTIWFSTPVNIQNFTTDFTFQITPTTGNVGDGMTFTLQNQGLTARGGVGGALGYQDVKPSVAVKFDLYSNSGEGVNSTGFYVNGAAPTVPATDLTPSGVNLHSGHVMRAHLTYDGTTLTLTLTDTVTNAAATLAQAINIPATVASNTAYAGFTGGTGGSIATQNVLSWTYTNGPPAATAATPTFTPVSGTYTSAQSVTIADATSGATIYYTTNGAVPTTASTVYAGPIPVSVSETIRAIAVASGLTNSAVGSATYTILQGTTATPTFSPAAGTYTAAQSVSLADTTSGATIHYSTDGTTPTTASSVYAGPITVSATQTIKALAVASGLTASAVGSATYTIQQGTTATPTFTPAAGTYTATQSVSLADTTSGAVIYYTTNGTTPTTASTVYSGPISVSATQTIKAIAVASGMAVSAVATAAYTINPVTGGTTPVNYPAGFASATGFTLDGGATVTGGALQVTDGGTFENRAIWYSTPLNIQSFTTDFTFQITAPNSNIGDGMTFAIQNQGLTARGGVGGSLGYQDVKPSVAVKFDLYSNSGEGTNSTGFYVNGAAPTVPAIDLTPSGVNLRSGNVMRAHLTYDGTTLTLTLTDTVTNATFTTAQAINIPATVLANTAYVGFTGGTGGSIATQNILSWTYTAGGSTPPPPTAATPTFTPVPGTYAAAQSVTLLDATSGATIYYTVNGATPTTASTLYAGPIAVSTSQTVKAMAVASGFSNSAVGAATYTIQGTAATPTFAPAAGTYPAAQSVTISDTTSGATIYYTTNGTTPTTASTAYTGPVAVSASQTLKAIAVANGFNSSAVGAATYTIQGTAATPTFSPAAGTYNAAQSVTISDTTSGAVIYYTTNGTTPTTGSTPYAGPIGVSGSQTLKAIAVASGFNNSAVGSAAYTIQGTTATPTFSPVAGTYTTAQSVTISDTTSGAVIYYTTDGTTPTTSSTVYVGPISVSASATLKAIALANGSATSALATAPYTINTTGGGSGNTPVNYPAGFAGATGFTSAGGAAVTGGALQVTDGGGWESRAIWYSTPVNVQRFTTDFTLQITGAAATLGDGMTFAIQNAGPSALGAFGGGLGYQGIKNSLAVKFDLYGNSGETNNSTGFYTNGAAPDVPSIDLTPSGVSLRTGHVLRAHLTYDGTTLTLTLTDTVTNATFTTAQAINLPATLAGTTAYVGFTGGSGGSTATQKVLSWTYQTN